MPLSSCTTASSAQELSGILSPGAVDPTGETLWEGNPRAVAFHRKYGFSHVAEQTFVLGADAQTDWVLARSLSPVPPSSGAAV